MTLSVIMPVYNERENLPIIVERVRQVPIDKELIIVDDGSTDGSREWLEQNVTGENEHVILHSKNLGKGSAIRTAIPTVTGDVVVIQDGDLEYDPADWVNMIQPILEGSAQVVYGSRTLGKNKEKSSWMFFLGGVVVSVVTSVLYGALITDAATCYKMVRADLLKSIPLTCTSFEFCHELTAKLRRRKIRIVEIPIKYYPRKVSEGKKVRLKDFFLALKMLIKYRFAKV